MAIPDYCDPRAEKHYVNSFVGSDRGDNGSMYGYRYDSTSGGKPTKMVHTSRYGRVCAYCGHQGLPLQPYFKGSFNPDSDDTVTGHMCICKDAMDELDINQAIRELKAKQAREMADLVNSAPKPSNKVLGVVLAHRVKVLTEEIDAGNLESLESFGVEVW